jgi:hypothetical protein
MTDVPLFLIGLCTEVKSDVLAFLDDNGITWWIPLVPLEHTLHRHLQHLFQYRRVAYDRVRSELWVTDPAYRTQVLYRLQWFPLICRFTITPVNGGGIPVRRRSCPTLRI